MAHGYPVTITWSGGIQGQGQLSLSDSIDLPIAVDSAFGGQGAGTNPEELATAAVGSCYTITLGMIVANKRLPVESVSATVTGVLEGQAPNLKFAAVRIEPVIRVSEPTNEQREQILQAAHRAEQLCLISTAMRGNVTITVEPQIEEV